MHTPWRFILHSHGQTRVRADVYYLALQRSQVRTYVSLKQRLEICRYNPAHPQPRNSSSAYKVLRIGAAHATCREKTAFERIASAAAHRGSICVHWPESVFEFEGATEGQEQNFNCFVFEPLGPNLLEYTNRLRVSDRLFFGYQNALLTATYLLHALDFLHANGIAHTGT